MCARYVKESWHLSYIAWLLIVNEGVSSIVHANSTHLCPAAAIRNGCLIVHPFLRPTPLHPLYDRALAAHKLPEQELLGLVENRLDYWLAGIFQKLGGIASTVVGKASPLCSNLL